MGKRKQPENIEVRGARVNNLKHVDVDVPLNSFVGVTGVSGSGKSSLALGVLYAEGSRRYLDGLSSYQRRRINQAQAPRVDSVEHVPAALALRQRPPAPGPRSSVATLSEVGAVLRLSMSRLGSHRCPEGHPVAATPAAWASERLVCPVDGFEFRLPSAESFSSASLGACPRCQGLGQVSEVDRGALIPDPSLTLDQGAVVPWRLTGRKHMPVVAKELGVRTDVPFEELTPREQEIVLDGPTTKRHVVITSKNGRAFEMDAVYESAVQSVLSLGTSARSSGERHGADRFLIWAPCPECGGSGLGPAARTSTLLGRTLPQLLALPLEALPGFSQELRDAASEGSGAPRTSGAGHDGGAPAGAAGSPVPFAPGDSGAPAAADLPALNQEPAAHLGEELLRAVEPLLRLGLGYLSPDRRGETLSTGERQRMELAATAMRRTTGMLYVLDEPTVGLHPEAVAGLVGVMDSIVEQGNSLVVVDHDVAVLTAADQLIEVGPGAGRHGGAITAQGTPAQLEADPGSVTGPYLARGASVVLGPALAPPPADEWLNMQVSEYLSLRDIDVRLTLGRISVITGVSGAGKSALIVDSLVPGIESMLGEAPKPAWVQSLSVPGLTRLVVADSTPIGANARSTPATYSGVFDEVRKRYAATDEAKARGWGASWFSYNTAKGGRCPECEGLGELSLDLQYLPDLEMVCPVCHGLRYTDQTREVLLDGLDIAAFLKQTIEDAEANWTGSAKGRKTLRSLIEVGLGYLTLGEATPALSGGESQRLRLATELGRGQDGGIFVFDEPSIGLHPRAVATLVGVLRSLVAAGGTVIVIEHDLDLIANADWIVDVGPGGGNQGGRIIAEGTVRQVLDGAPGTEGSVIAPWLRAHLGANS
ncbi:excinuclease ABC subunit UvrA [Galactobacter valiniphilus]|uniref:excinuclease ABC subunit UvrA n=1 Tax=Galactobacter valiniphilus TaxID=2676122 RepID=UPI0037361619